MKFFETDFKVKKSDLDELNHVNGFKRLQNSIGLKWLVKTLMTPVFGSW
jgi:acyl-ACP thioesterase